MKKLYIVAAVSLSLFLVACGQNDDLTNALATSAQVAARNQELVASNTQLARALNTENQKVAKLTGELAQAKADILAEREAKWRARNEVIGAKKVAQGSVVAAHAVGVQQAKVTKPKVK